jgi:serine/threonine-protein kinase
VLRAHLSAPPPVPSALQPAARRFDKVVTTAMAKRSEDRFADTDAFRKALLSAWATPEHTLAQANTGPAYPTTRLIDAARSGHEPPLTPLGATGRRAALDYLSPADATPPPTPRPTQASGVAPQPGGSAAGIAVAAIAGVAVLAVLSAFSATGTAARPTPSVAAPSALPSASASPSPSVAAPTTVSVPSLSGSLTSAKAALVASGLYVGKVTQLPSVEPSGTVLGQSPEAGALVAPGSPVTLQIASGSNTVPEVGELRVEAAIAALESAGFVVPDSTVGVDPEAVVTGTQPTAGALLRLGKPVQLLLMSPTPAASEPSPTPSVSSPP